MWWGLTNEPTGDEVGPPARTHLAMLARACHASVTAHTAIRAPSLMVALAKKHAVHLFARSLVKSLH